MKRKNRKIKISKKDFELIFEIFDYLCYLWNKENLCFLIIIFFVFIFFVFLRLFLRGREKINNENLFCPIRSFINTKIYDNNGKLTEEYHRIELIKKLLRIGFYKEDIDLNYRIRVGHGGRNSFIPDLVLKKRNGKVFLVVEVKKDSKNIEKAVVYQLQPAFKILDSRYGMYYDGTKKSFIFDKGKKIVRGFDFEKIPKWFFYEWKNF